MDLGCKLVRVQEHLRRRGNDRSAVAAAEHPFDVLCILAARADCALALSKGETQTADA